MIVITNEQRETYHPQEKYQFYTRKTMPRLSTSITVPLTVPFLPALHLPTKCIHFHFKVLPF
jgi:hypothetical protein